TQYVCAGGKGAAVLLAFVSACSAAPAVQAANTKPHLVIAIRDYANLPPETLDAAKGQVSKIFEKAGVEVEYSESTAPVSGGVDGPAVRPTAWVKLLPDSMARRLRRSQGALGCSTGDQVYIFADDVLKAATHAKIDYPITLGQVMAHEIGHVLLGQDSHAPTGMMSPYLSSSEFQEMKTGHLLFHDRQARKIRERLLCEQDGENAATLSPFPAERQR
ncbi:MAG: hypothetical protein ACE141_06650, partial [Bryobacteraceae bacterium]